MTSNLSKRCLILASPEGQPIPTRSYEFVFWVWVTSKKNNNNNNNNNKFKYIYIHTYDLHLRPRFSRYEIFTWSLKPPGAKSQWGCEGSWLGSERFSLVLCHQGGFFVEIRAGNAVVFFQFFVMRLVALSTSVGCKGWTWRRWRQHLSIFFVMCLFLVLGGHCVAEARGRWCQGRNKTDSSEPGHCSAGEIVPLWVILPVEDKPSKTNKI